MAATNRQPAWAKLKVGLIARANIREAIRRHPNAPLHVRSGSEIYELPKADLLALASKLGVNIKAKLSETEYDLASSSAEESYFPFKGTIEFELALGVLGKSTTRKVRLTYKHSPDWAYLDPRSGGELLGVSAWSFTAMHIEALDGPNGDERSWQECEVLTAPGVWSDEMWQAIEVLIDVDCRKQDESRRAEMAD